jgi:hypothetical protein
MVSIPAKEQFFSGRVFFEKREKKFGRVSSRKDKKNLVVFLREKIKYFW